MYTYKIYASCKQFTTQIENRNNLVLGVVYLFRSLLFENGHCLENLWSYCIHLVNTCASSLTEWKMHFYSSKQTEKPARHVIKYLRIAWIKLKRPLFAKKYIFRKRGARVKKFRSNFRTGNFISQLRYLKKWPRAIFLLPAREKYYKIYSYTPHNFCSGKKFSRTARFLAYFFQLWIYIGRLFLFIYIFWAVL